MSDLINLPPIAKVSENRNLIHISMETTVYVTDLDLGDYFWVNLEHL